MKKFWIVFKYEFSTQVKNKTFLAVSGLFVVLAIVGGFLITSPFSKGDEGPGTIEPTTLLVYTTDEYKEYITQLETSGMYTLEFKDSAESLKVAVEEQEEKGIIVNNFDHIEQVVAGTSIMDLDNQLGQTLELMYQNKLLLDKGLNLEEIAQIQSTHITFETINVGVDGTMGFIYTYAFSMVLYMVVMLYGSVVSSSVITEKSSKAMELLITSAKPTALVSGKVIATGMACLLQLGSIIVLFIASFKIFSANKPIGIIFEMIGGIPVGVIMLALFLFLVGFFSILFLFAGFSSFASKPEDANTVASPLIVVILVVFMVNMSSMGTNLLDTTPFIILSYVPILSPFLMFSRYVLFGLTTFEIVLGVITNLLGAIGLIYFAAKIYRAGTLHYGNKIKLSNIFRSFKI